MQIGMIGLGRMGANMVRRLLKAGHECVVYDIDTDNVEALVKEGAQGASSLEDFAGKLVEPRTAWLMLPAGIVAKNVDDLAAFMKAGDIIIDGGNSHYKEAIDTSARLKPKDIDFVDVGTSGGVWGLERGYCLMIGGPDRAVRHLGPVFAALAPGPDGKGAKPPASGEPTAPLGYLHCGQTGAGHFVKMVHNGIEYGVMAAYAEGLNVLKAGNAGAEEATHDAETTPLDNPEYFKFDIDLADVSEVWRHGSVIGSWLLDLSAQSLKTDSELSRFDGRVSDSGEGRWTVKAAIDTGVPVPVLSSALFQRFSSRGESDFADRLLSAMRFAFGGHVEKPEE